MILFKWVLNLIFLTTTLLFVILMLILILEGNIVIIYPTEKLLTADLFIWLMSIVVGLVIKLGESNKK